MKKRVASLLHCFRVSLLHCFLALLFFVIAGCADKNFEQADGGMEVATDASSCPDWAPDICGGYCVDWREDPDNCGSCGNGCSGLESDHCSDGLCRCGNGAACDSDSGQACHTNRTGGTRCEYPDTNGQPCDPVEGNICTGLDEECVFGAAGGFCTVIIFTSEQCDNIDNDGDGLVDEPEDTAIGCYDGPPETLGVAGSLCQPGIKWCSWDKFKGVEWTDCLGQILPVPEGGILACDGVDNDCDGCVDGVTALGDKCGPADPEEFDIVFMIDISGSMGDNIAAVQAAVDTFSGAFLGNDSFHFALVLFPWTADQEVDVYDDPSTPELDGDLEEYSVFASALASMPTNFGASEANYDAPYRLATGDLALSWRSWAQRIYILFTDEGGQSYITPEVSEYDMCVSVDSSDIFAAVVDPYSGDQFDCIFAGVNPTVLYYLSSDVTDMVDNLNGILSSPCE